MSSSSTPGHTDGTSESSRASSDRAHSVLSRGGEMGARIRAFDWSKTPLGPITGWPQSLKTSVSICLASRFPIVLYWGPEFVVLYNDAYSQILGSKHPWALGQTCQVCWAEIWDTIEPMMNGVVSTGYATWSGDLLLRLRRFGYPEECYFSFSFSPVQVESGAVGGIFTAVIETTEKVVGERRLRTLRDLAARAVDAKTQADAWRIAANTIAENPADVPFAIFAESSGDTLCVSAAAGISNTHPLVAALCRPDSELFQKAMQVIRTGQRVEVEDLASSASHLPCGAWETAPQCAVLLPVIAPGLGSTGVVLAAVSPAKKMDDSYSTFFNLLARQVSTSIADARAHDEERRRAEALAIAQEASRRLAAIVESSDDAIVSKDLNGIVTSWNRQAERLFGYTEEEMIGRSILTIIPPELHSDEDIILAKIRSGQKIDHFETVRVSKSGERIEVSLSISPVRDERGTIVGAAKIARDIRENKKIERTLRTTEKLAAAGRLAATVAHEINNPLEAVTNLVYLAQHDLRNPEKLGSYLSLAQHELDRVAHITRQTLGFYRDTSSALRFNVSQVLDDLLLLYERRLQARNIRIIRDYDKSAELEALPGEIRQAFSNLLSNAMDAMPAGGTLKIRVRAARQWSRSQQRGVRITIADSGSGISPEHRRNLFQPFFTTKADIGTGLGLWITRGIVEKHGGAIRVKSSTGIRHGTSFSIFLPLSGNRAAQPAIVEAVA